MLLQRSTLRTWSGRLAQAVRSLPMRRRPNGVQIPVIFNPIDLFLVHDLVVPNTALDLHANNKKRHQISVARSVQIWTIVRHKQIHVIRMRCARTDRSEQNALASR